MHHRVEDVVVVAHHHIGPHRDIDGQLKWTDVVRTGNGFDTLTIRQASFEQFSPRRWHAFVIAIRIAARFGIARPFAEADALLGGNRYGGEFGA